MPKRSPWRHATSSASHSSVEAWTLPPPDMDHLRSASVSNLVRNGSVRIGEEVGSGSDRITRRGKHPGNWISGDRMGSVRTGALDQGGSKISGLCTTDGICWDQQETRARGSGRGRSASPSLPIMDPLGSSTLSILYRIGSGGISRGRQGGSRNGT